ncbi:MAG: SGNH/GDSL hydrolase family protein [Spirochaetes bacterium]|nr:SGNH/GDSL hydrolase family protein [Spirochaetota bacterium]
MIRKILVIAGVLAVLCAGIFLYGSHMAQRLPDNSPGDFLRSNPDRKDKKVIVCVGDSITHGRVSHNYVDMLIEKSMRKDLIFINAGVNDELAYNVLSRIDEIIRLRPDLVTILIGTNDANASLDPENAARAVRSMNLPRAPEKAWFAKNLAEICRRLKNETPARIALMSIPPIGESPESPSFRASIEYSTVIRDTARREGCAYLPLNERMVAYLKANPRPVLHPYSELQSLMYVGIFKHLILRKSFDEIAEGNGFQLLTDFLHLNGRGAGMISELILEFIGEK